MPDIQLVVSTPPGERRTYKISKPETTIGRFPGNDIVLYDSQASRQHARLRMLPNGFEIEDLGSTNATLLNGKPVQRARVQVGDTISIGSSSLQFQDARLAPLLENPQTVGELTAAAQQMEIEVADVSQPRLVVQMPNRTWDVLLTGDAIVIGRDVNCQIVLEDRSASRQHASVTRQGNEFVLTDLGSRNGTWQQGKRIEKHNLGSGDSFQIGTATLVYKGPVDQESATRPVDYAFMPHQGKRRPVVFVPGFLGSELWRGSEQIWPNLSAMLAHPEWYRWPSKDAITAPRLVSEMVIVPNFIKLERHNELGDFLDEGMGYERGKDFLEFPWDWRLDLRVVARQLAARIAQWREHVKEADGPITLISHSTGCLVARYYVEKLGGSAVVNRMILIGGAHSGLPKTLIAHAGFGKQALHYRIAEQFQRAIASLPSVYFLLPSYPAVFNSTGQPLDLYRDEAWCPEEYRPLLRRALGFHQELGTKSSVPSISVFGYGLPTVERAILEDRQQGRGWERVRFEMDNKGDDSVPQVSSRLPQTEIHPVRQHHGALYADKDVKIRLQIELMR